MATGRCCRIPFRSVFRLAGGIGFALFGGVFCDVSQRAGTRVAAVHKLLHLACVAESLTTGACRMAATAVKYGQL